jgi:carboxypeptidase C (cathepsin A)
MQVAGRVLHYRATAGYLPIRDPAGNPLADIFFVAYEREDANSSPAPDLTRVVPAGPDNQTVAPTGGRPVRGGTARAAGTRPLTFAFNGGPGASAVWLHMALGPKRAVLGSAGTALPATDALIDNESTWLEFTDLVFVDPVGTGFSRAAPGVDVKQFYEVQKDVEVSAEFIRRYVTRHERWLSPQFIVGESYGTTRAAALARYLQEHCGLYLRGLILLSSALNMATISFDPGNDLPYVLALPSYTAVAGYHGLLPEKSPLNLRKDLERVRTWALEEYLVTLAQGSPLPETRFRETASRLAEYTGLPEETVVQNHLRISNFVFVQELLAGQRQVLGLLDGRVTTADGGAGPRRYTDPSFFVVTGPFVATFNSYVRSELGFRSERAYVFLSTEANQSWKWQPDRQGYLNVAPKLAEAMNLDPYLRVFAAAGAYDLTTPFLSQEYVLNHLDLAGVRRKNITLRLYSSGHQIYTSLEALQQLTSDVQAFLVEPETP